jgi:AAA+ ATPase superfamily predicted ATPase
MTVVTGRRRIGKTSLILKALEDTPAVYLFVSKKNEADLCRDFSAAISESLGLYVSEEIGTFQSLFKTIMELSVQKSFSLIIDEFQDFTAVNPSIYSSMQHIWDLNKNKTRINLVLAGSVYSLMEKIFRNSKEPLFGRADNIINLDAFDTGAMKEILKDHRPKYSNDELLAFYTFTGGIPKYMELFCDNKILTINGMIDFMIRDNSLFIEEGRFLLIEEFGRDYGLYFSILSAVSRGINTQGAIQSYLGNTVISGHIKRLIEDYRILSRRRPLLAKEGTQTVRLEITDNFLQFWFRFIDRYRSLTEMKNFEALRKIIKADYTTYSGLILERYFRKSLAESGEYRDIGGWWKGGRSPATKPGPLDQNEIDILALTLEEDKAIAIEVKRQKKNFRPDLLEAKTEYIKQKVLPGYKIDCLGLTLEDM